MPFDDLAKAEMALHFFNAKPALPVCDVGQITLMSSPKAELLKGVLIHRRYEMKKVKEILIKTRALIEDPKNWIQRTNARDANRNKVIPEEKSAVCFCINGAVRRICGGTNNDCYYHTAEALRLTADFLFEDSFVNVNDKNGHAAVLQLIDAVIEEHK